MCARLTKRLGGGAEETIHEWGPADNYASVLLYPVDCVICHCALCNEPWGIAFSQVLQLRRANVTAQLNIEKRNATELFDGRPVSAEAR